MFTFLPYVFVDLCKQTCISSGVYPGEHHVRKEGVNVIPAEVAASVRQPGDCVAIGQQLGRNLLDALLGW